MFVVIALGGMIVAVVAGIAPVVVMTELQERE